MQNNQEQINLKDNQRTPKINEISKKIMEEKEKSNLLSKDNDKDKDKDKDLVYNRLYKSKIKIKEKDNDVNNINNINKLKSNSLLQNIQSQMKDLRNQSVDFIENNKNNNYNKNSISNNYSNKKNLIGKNKHSNLNINTNTNSNLNTMDSNFLNNNVMEIKKSKTPTNLNSNFSAKKFLFNNNNNNINKRNNKTKEINEKEKEYGNVNSIKNPLDNSNKFLFKKFTEIFRNNFEEIFNDYIKTNSESNYTKGFKLDFLIILMKKLKFFDLENGNFNLEKEKEKDKINTDNIIELSPLEAIMAKDEINNSINLNLNLKEKRSLLEIYDSLRDSEGYITIDHFYIFCLAILDLFEYYVLKAFFDKEKSENKQNLNSQIDKKMLDKINLDLKGRIIYNKKYGGFDEFNNFIITFDQAKLIHKNFHALSTNWYKSIRNTKNKIKEIEELNAESITFKPKINRKSAKIGNEYRKKIVNEIEAENNNKGNNILEYNIGNKRSSENLNYFDMINLKKKRQEKYIEKFILLK
jgi:hypothetical protein